MSDTDLRQRIADLTAILEVTRQLGATTDLDQLLELIVAQSLRVLGAERGSVFLYDARRSELVSRVATGEQDLRVPADKGIVGAVAQSRQIVNVCDAYGDPRFNPAVDRKTGFRTRNLLTVPLTGHDAELVGVLQILNKREGSFGPQDEYAASILGAQAGVALQRARLLDEYVEKKRIQRDLDIARSIQQAFLPKDNPRIEGYDIAGWNRPADETGGDCYDFFPLPGGRLSFSLADATGHGIGAALMISECRALLRGFLSDWEGDVARVLDKTNRILCRDLPSGRFVTAFVGVLEPQFARITWASAGHGPLLLYRRAEDRVDTMPAQALPLGIMDDLGLPVLEPITLDAGDAFVLITDGFFEWADPAEEQFGTQRIADLVRRQHDLSAEGLIHAMRGEVEAFAAGTPQADDLTALVVKRTERA